MNEVAAPTFASIADLQRLDLRVGTITAAERNAKARQPAYLLTIDFGPLGIKASSAQLTENYSLEELIGRQVVAVVNFPPKLVAGIKSECLVLAALCEKQGTVLLQQDMLIANGSRIA